MAKLAAAAPGCNPIRPAANRQNYHCCRRLSRTSQLKRRAARIAVRVLQWGVVLAILAYLFSDIYRNDSFAKFWDGPKRWDLLAAALGLTLAGVTITIVRWHWLIRALGLPFRLRDALRLGFLGYLLNFVSFGS